MSSKNFMAYGDAESVLTGYATRIKQSPTTFIGTIAQWNALSAEDKARYTLVNLTDDGETGETVDAVIDGDMRPVTSNAVYDEFIVLPAQFTALSFSTGVQQLTVQVANIPAGYKGFGIATWDIGRLDGLNLTGVSVSESGLCRIGIYADKAHSGDLNGTVMCIFRKTT